MTHLGIVDPGRAGVRWSNQEHARFEVVLGRLLEVWVGYGDIDDDRVYVGEMHALVEAVQHMGPEIDIVRFTAWLLRYFAQEYQALSDGSDAVSATRELSAHLLGAAPEAPRWVAG